MPSKKATQRQLAKALGISQQAVSKMLDQGVITAGGSLDQWIRQAYLHRAEQAAGRKGGGILDLAQERARLARAQSEAVEMKNAQSRGELERVDVLAAGVIGAFAVVRTKLLGLHHRIRSIVPYLKPGDVGNIENLIREVLTELSHARLPERVVDKMRERREAEPAPKKKGVA